MARKKAGISSKIISLFRRVRRIKYFWDVLALSITLLGVLGYYITQILRAQQGYLTPAPEVALLEIIFETIISGTLIGWLLAFFIQRARRKG